MKHSAIPPSHCPPWALIGAGAVATAFGRRLRDAGYRIRAVLSRRPGPARALADAVGASVASDNLSDLPEDVRVVLVCVPDDALSEVAAQLASCDHPWDATIVAHTSGARPASALDALAPTGSALLSVHPMQTFTLDTPPSAFDGIVVSVEGDPRATGFGLELAEEIGARPVPISTDAKTQVHCAAALASNGLVALMAAVEEVLGAAGVSGPDARAMMRPLVDQTWANLADAAPEAVLTGPAARGDRGTIRAHMESLHASTPHLQPLYAALTTEAVRVAMRHRLSAEDAEALLKVLQTALSSSDAPSRREPG